MQDVTTHFYFLSVTENDCSIARNPPLTPPGNGKVGHKDTEPAGKCTTLLSCDVFIQTHLNVISAFLQRKKKPHTTECKLKPITAEQIWKTMKKMTKRKLQNLPGWRDHLYYVTMNMYIKKKRLVISNQH